MTERERLILIRVLYNAILNDTVTFHGRVGGDFAYLAGAISETPDRHEYCEFSPKSGIVKILRNNFAPDHKVWSFIKLTKE